MIRPAKARYFMSRSSRYEESPTLVPPKLTELGHQSFTAVEHASLARWLQEATWPKGTLDIHGLEGYLTALLVWPVELQPGAWLPPIWNQGGWKIPPPIETTERYQDFLELVLGYLRTLDKGLMDSPPFFLTRLGLPLSEGSFGTMDCIQRWALGFGRGLQQTAQSRVVPDLDTRESVRSIATYAAGRVHGNQGHVRQAYGALAQAALELAAKRRSRGPLGLLAKQPDTLKPLVRVGEELGRSIESR